MVQFNNEYKHLHGLKLRFKTRGATITKIYVVRTL